MTRRAFFAAVCGAVTPATAAQAATGSIHHEVVLMPDNGSGDGYYALCGEKGCSPIDAIGISVHPKGFFAPNFAAMANRRVQFSLFPVEP